MHQHARIRLCLPANTYANDSGFEAVELVEVDTRAQRASVRGVNLMRTRDGQIVEARGYVKGA